MCVCMYSVCMYVCMYVQRMYVRMYVCMYVCITLTPSVVNQSSQFRDDGLRRLLPTVA
jgi:hypothetical protein